MRSTSSNKVVKLSSKHRNDKNTKNAASWNSHLIHARRIRGPQFDINTQQFQFDSRSNDHYTQSSDPTLGAVKNLLNQNQRGDNAKPASKPRR